MNKKLKSELDNFYNIYSAPLYGVISKIVADEKQAEDIFVKSFKLFFTQHGPAFGDKLIFLNLLRVTINLIAERIHMSKKEIKKLVLRTLTIY